MTEPGKVQVVLGAQWGDVSLALLTRSPLLSLLTTFLSHL